MDTFLRLKKVLVASLSVSEQAITPDITLGHLFHRAERQDTNPQMAPDADPDSIISGLSPDSLDRVELVMWLEDEFGLEISEEEVKKLPPMIFDTNMTVQQLVEFIDNHFTSG
jgi:acyl carrier protein